MGPHPAIAITDHGVVQAFPEAFAAAKKAGIKLIPGCEGYLLDDAPAWSKTPTRASSPARPSWCWTWRPPASTPCGTPSSSWRGQVRNRRGGGGVSQLISPMRPAREIVESPASPTMLSGMPTLDRVVPGFHEFCKGAALAAHNAEFDMAFVGRAFALQGYEMDHPVIDTLSLSRNMFRDQKSHKLGAVCKRLGISLKNAHRAVHDARATAQALVKMLDLLGESRSVRRLSDSTGVRRRRGRLELHIILLAATQQGMTNPYRLERGAPEPLRRTPRLPRPVMRSTGRG